MKPADNAGTLWVLAGLCLAIALHAVLRACGLFGPPETRFLVLLSFLVLWPTPWLFLNRAERTMIGFGGARSWKLWPLSIVVGAALAALTFALCNSLFAQTSANPFVSIRNSYLSGAGIPDLGSLALFAVFTGPALVASPIGEEFLSRAVIHQRFAALGGWRFGVGVSAMVFASLHLMHHGVIYQSGALSFVGVSGALWFVLMFAVSIAFSLLRRSGGTIWMPVLAHAAFNATMNAGIFLIWPQP